VRRLLFCYPFFTIFFLPFPESFYLFVQSLNFLNLFQSFTSFKSNTLYIIMFRNATFLSLQSLKPVVGSSLIAFDAAKLRQELDAIKFFAVF